MVYAMTVTVRALIEAKNAESSQTTQYTSSGITTIIDKFTATNYDTAPHTLSVSLVPSGGSVDNSNLIVKTKTLQGDETYTFPEIVGQVLNAGDFISTIASAATSINIRASGRAVT